MSNRTNVPVKIIGERDIELHISNPDHYDRLAAIGRALSSPVRLKILNILKNATLSIQEVAQVLELPMSSAALHIKTLEDAQLIVTETRPGRHGSMRVCTLCMQSFHLETFDEEADLANNTVTVDMPVGSYYDFDIRPTCGLANENGVIDAYDSVRSFYSPAHTGAKLLWFQQGYVEYRFPNLANPLLPLKELSFRMEICSEAPGYAEQWPSDITICVNDRELATYTSPGDFGERRGLLTPPVWPNGRTQYGILKTFSVQPGGVYVDGTLADANVTLKDLELNSHPYISLKICIKEDAQHIGGINIFGETFGDYPQGIVMNLIY